MANDDGALQLTRVVTRHNSAVAVFLGIDEVRDWLSPETKLVGFPDAGFFLDYGM